VSAWQNGHDHEHILPVGEAGLATVRAIAQWVLDYRADGEDQGFPFDVPYLDLFDRCRNACRATDAYLRKVNLDRRVRKGISRLRRLLDPIETQAPFTKAAAILRADAAIFSELRDALRLRQNADGKKCTVLNAEEAANELRDIKSAVRKFTASLEKRRPGRGPAQERRQAIDVVLTHLRRHGPNLFGHVIRLPKSTGGGIRLVDRTNNILEGLFHELKHGERRRSGRKVLTQDLEQLPPAAALALNLKSKDYVAIVCTSLDQLPQAFARLDAQSRRRSLIVIQGKHVTDASDCDVASASLPRLDRELIRTAGMDRRIHAAAKSRAPRTVTASR
jgi:hypothetical protein